MIKQKQIGYFAALNGRYQGACKGENLLVMNNPVEMKKFVKKEFKFKSIELIKVYSNKVIKGLELGGHYLFSEKSYKDFISECIDKYPHLFPPNRLIVQEPVSDRIFYQVSWIDTVYNTPKE